MNPVALVSGFIPLVLFSLINGHVAVAGAAVIAAVAAVVIAVVNARRGPALAIVQAVTLAVIAVTAATGSSGTQHWLSTYGGGLASLALAAFMLLTVPFAPFTAAIARSGLPREAWASRRFLDTNRRISAAWGAAVLVLGVCHLATAAMDTSSLSRFQAHLIEWGPAIVAVVLALRYTKRTIAEAHAGQPADHAQSAPTR